MSRRPRIVIVGSTMIDMIAYADPLPRAGETVVGSSFGLGFGGKGANQSVMAARLGAEVVFVNRIGDDVFGQMTLENLTAEGLDTRAVRPVEGASTGVAPIWVEQDGTNRIIVIPGANECVTAEVVREELDALDGADCVICQLEVPQEAAVAAFELGRAWGCPTVLNPAPATPLTTRLLSLTDWLVPNENEFELLFGRTPDAASLQEITAPRIVVTLGEAGAACWNDEALLRVAPPLVETVDTTGAGDAFVAGFGIGLATGLELPHALALGNACGALSVGGRGTQASFPNRSAVNALLKHFPTFE